MAAVWAAFVAAAVAPPGQAERCAAAVDRRQHGAVARAADPSAEAWAALPRAVLCRGGVERMRADADAQVRGGEHRGARGPRSFRVLPGSSAVTSMPATLILEDAIGIGDVGAPDVLAYALCERSWWQ